MGAIPCFTVRFERGEVVIDCRIVLEKGKIILGEGVGKRMFDTTYQDSFLTSIMPRNLHKICEENLKKLPSQGNKDQVLLLCKTKKEGVDNTAQGHSKAFKGTPFEIQSGRGIRIEGTERNGYLDSLWLLKQDDEVLIVEQGNTSHHGVVLLCDLKHVIRKKLPREHFSEDSE